MNLSGLLSRARILTANRDVGLSVGAVSFAGSGKGNRSGTSSKQVVEKQVVEKTNFRGKCFRCEGPHMARDCPDKKLIRCFTCGVEGHISYNCPKGKNSSFSGNE